MTITPAAADMIRDSLRRSAIAHAVIYLAQVSKTPAEIDQAIERGATRDDIRGMALSAMATEPKYLYPLVYPCSHFLWLTTTVNGFRFASRFFHPPAVRRALKRGLLDVAEPGLVLKDADGTVILPRRASSAL
jgi:hypothetical protein